MRSCRSQSQPTEKRSLRRQSYCPTATKRTFSFAFCFLSCPAFAQTATNAAALKAKTKRIWLSALASVIDLRSRTCVRTIETLLTCLQLRSLIVRSQCAADYSFKSLPLRIWMPDAKDPQSGPRQSVHIIHMHTQKACDACHTVRSIHNSLGPLSNKQLFEAGSVHDTQSRAVHLH
jgi:hypothetical protein